MIKVFRKIPYNKTVEANQGEKFLSQWGTKKCLIYNDDLSGYRVDDDTALTIDIEKASVYTFEEAWKIAEQEKNNVVFHFVKY